VGRFACSNSARMSGRTPELGDRYAFTFHFVERMFWYPALNAGARQVHSSAKFAYGQKLFFFRISDLRACSG
jgi:hypothetical protein